MKIYDVITTNIKNYMEKFEKDVDFKVNYPDISIISYLSKQTGLTIRRLNDILNGISKVIIDNTFSISSGSKKSCKKSGTSSNALTSKALVIKFINFEKIWKAKLELKTLELLIYCLNWISNSLGLSKVFLLV